MVLRRLLRLRSGYELAQANVPADWSDGDAWRDWEPPRDLVRGESHHRPTLRKLCGGGPRDAGYLIPVPVELIREVGNQYDRNAIASTSTGSTSGTSAASSRRRSLRASTVRASPPASSAACCVAVRTARRTSVFTSGSGGASPRASRFAGETASGRCHGRRDLRKELSAQPTRGLM